MGGWGRWQHAAGRRRTWRAAGRLTPQVGLLVAGAHAARRGRLALPAGRRLLHRTPDVALLCVVERVRCAHYPPSRGGAGVVMTKELALGLGLAVGGAAYL